MRSHRDLSPLKTILAGGIAGCLCVVAIPVDTLKSRYQTGEIMVGSCDQKIM